jgi:poly [ADP-ribose] polymerase
MLLNEVAYGIPYVCYDFNSKYYNFTYDSLQKEQKGANCLHAKSDKGMLRNDEIIVYKEEQVTVKYLVELK